MASNAVFHTSLDETTTARAVQVLRELGLSVTDAIDLMLARVANEERLPFTPNPTTQAAIDAARRGEVTSFDSVEALMADLNAKD